MLDLTKLTVQMQGIGKYLAQETIASRQRLERAQQALLRASQQQPDLVALRSQWHDQLAFSTAEPVEPLQTCKPIASPPAQQTVIATDGSQIAPSHHEIAYCYLINIGRVMIHYGQERAPLLDSLPEVFYHPEDLYRSRQWGIRTEDWMGHQRTVSEAQVLAEMGQSLGTNPAFPVLALLDGSLVYRSLEPLPKEARAFLLPPMLEAWAQLQRLGMPLMSYLSASRSSETLNFLRLACCPFSEPNCEQHCAEQRTGGVDRTPCQVFVPLRDGNFWTTILQPGERGPLWHSCAPILAEYGPEQQIYFCHVHVGSEIARVEFPAWVAQNEVLLEQALGLVLGQVQKGYGYPIALAEAHNQAVVRGSDRAHFFALLERQMIKAGLRNIGTSYKETRKRGSIA